MGEGASSLLGDESALGPSAENAKLQPVAEGLDHGATPAAAEGLCADDRSLVLVKLPSANSQGSEHAAEQAEAAPVAQTLTGMLTVPFAVVDESSFVLQTVISTSWEDATSTMVSTNSPTDEQE